MNSKAIKEGNERACQRSLLLATGIPRSDLNKPLVGIVNSFNGINPGHIHLNELVQAVKLGVAAKGGVPWNFPRSPCATASPWDTRECATLCPAGN